MHSLQRWKAAGGGDGGDSGGGCNARCDSGGDGGEGGNGGGDSGGTVVARGHPRDPDPTRARPVVRCTSSTADLYGIKMYAIPTQKLKKMFHACGRTTTIYFSTRAHTDARFTSK